MPKQQRETKQRVAIRKAIRTENRPLQPKEIQSLAQRDCGGLGIATVYRNLSTMVDDGEIEKLELHSMVTCYSLPRESKTPILMCYRTGEIHWLESTKVKIKLPKTPDNFEPIGYEVVIFGQFRNGKAKRKGKQ